MKELTTCLWFNNQAEAAANFYTSIFKHSKIGSITHYGAAGARASGQPEGSVMTVEFEIDGRKFMGLNGGPDFPFNEAVSFVVNCSDQEEIDDYWTRLTEDGGAPGPCGWLKDKFGLSWQIVPAELMDMHADTDPAKRERVMTAMLGMQKLDLETLRQAYKGEPMSRREGSTVRV
jgi:predicted 3-demethylubiquinone-9 3-methyltransferase (glyoxalase superfamily)